MYLEKFVSSADKNAEICEKEIYERVSQHSCEFDKRIANTRGYSSEEIREAWQVRKWKIGDAVVSAVGVSHVPETFLEFRQEIEKNIQESDVVVNEFAPEALGFYDKTAAPRLQSIKSKFNENYSLEELRQAYLKYERPYGVGLFHHEIELLAAKYGKDMAVADLTLNKCPEDLFQDNYLYAYGAEEIRKREVALKKTGLYTSSALLGLAGLGDFLRRLKKPVPNMMSRRNFLKLGLTAGVAATLAGITPKITEAPPRKTLKKETEMDGQSDDGRLEKLRDPMLVVSLRRLVKLGYKKITFIYGTAHLKRVEQYLNDPGKTERELADNKDLIERHNPNPFRVYRLFPGENISDSFVASKKRTWRPIN